MQDRVLMLRRLAEGALDLVRRHRAELDSLNVFPVADSDTGTNVCLTLAAALDALPRSTEASAGEGAGTGTSATQTSPGASATDVAAALARGALLGARGNSGVILGQYLGELVVTLAEPAEPAEVRRPGGRAPATALTGTEIATALGRAAAAARRAVARPVEGTVLTVADDVAREATRAAVDGSDAVATVAAAVAEGRRAVGRTPTQLDALASAGLEDAGGWALVLVLEALGAATAGTAVPDVVGPGHRVAPQPAPCPVLDLDAEADLGLETGARAHEHHEADGEFELMALARTDEVAAVDVLRAGLGRIGESLAVIGRAGLWQVHVHTDHVVEAMSLLLGPGLGVRQVVVRHLLAVPERPAGGVVMVTRTPGLVADLARSSAVVVLGGTEGDAVVRAVEDTGREDVLVLVEGAAGRGGELPPGVRLRAGLDAGHLVAAAAGLALAPGDVVGPAVLDRVGSAVDAVRTATVDPGEGGDEAPRVGAARHDDVVDVARGLLAGLGETVEVLTVVTSRGTPAPVVEAVRGALGGTVEVVVIEGGAPGSAVVLAAEPAQ